MQFSIMKYASCERTGCGRAALQDAGASPVWKDVYGFDLLATKSAQWVLWKFVFCVDDFCFVV